MTRTRTFNKDTTNTRTHGQGRMNEDSRKRMNGRGRIRIVREGTAIGRGYEYKGGYSDRIRILRPFLVQEKGTLFKRMLRQLTLGEDKGGTAIGRGYEYKGGYSNIIRILLSFLVQEKRWLARKSKTLARRRINYATIIIEIEKDFFIDVYILIVCIIVRCK